MRNPIAYLKYQRYRNPEAAALFYRGRAITYRQFDALVSAAAVGLREAGIRPGQLVAVSIEDILLHWIVTFALWHEATLACSVPQHVASPAGLDFKFAVVDGSRPASELGADRSIVAGAEWLQELEARGGTVDPIEYPDLVASARLILSSGTTGEPKAVALSVAGLHERALTRNTLDPLAGIELTFFDPCNSIGIYNGLRALMTGRPQIIVSTYEQVRADLEALDVTNLSGSPAHLAALLDALGDGWGGRPVDSVALSGSALSPRLIGRIARVFGPHIYNIYGATEVGPVATCPVREIEREPRLAGFILPGVEVEVVDDHGRVQARGESGELRIRAAHMASNYVGARDGEVSALRDGWFYPGDLAQVRDDGALLIDGRVSDLLNLGGLKINPVVVDRFLASCNGVVEALSFEFQDEGGATRLGSALVLASGAQADALPAAIAQGLPPLLRPATLFVVDAIARNAAGKPLRSQTRDNALRISSERTQIPGTS